MRKLYIATITFLCCINSQGQKAWNYVGVPYVTDNVPSAIMPILPSGADTPAFSYDPTLLATPTFTGAANQYFVDSVIGNDATAANSGRGNPESPRKSLPNLNGSNWPLPNNIQIFLNSNSEFFTGGEDVDLNVQGSEDGICWIIGVGDGATLGCRKFFMGGQHIIIHNIRFIFANDGPRIGFGSGSGGLTMKYGTMRHCLVDGLGDGFNSAISGSGLSANQRSSFIYLYKNVIRNLGDWDRQDSNGVDRHGVQMTAYTDHWWIIENQIYHCEGDSVQINTSSQNNSNYASRPHYIYIAGNEFFENYENAVDNKNCYHAVISQNRMYNFYNEFKIANETAFILANDDEGWLSGYEWALMNQIYNCGTGIRFAGTAALTVDNPLAVIPVQISGQKSYAIGNLIYNAGVGIVLDARGTSPAGSIERTWFEETWSVHNTIVSSIQPINQTRGNTIETEPGFHYIIGNLLYNLGNSREIDVGTTEFNTVQFNLIDRKAGQVNLLLSRFNIFTANKLNIDPKFRDEFSNDYRVIFDSPAVNLIGDDNVMFTQVNIPAPYILFQNLYGINIQFTIDNIPRLSGTLLDAGAYEYEIIPPSPPNNVKKNDTLP